MTLHIWQLQVCTPVPPPGGYGPTRGDRGLLKTGGRRLITTAQLGSAGTTETATVFETHWTSGRAVEAMYNSDAPGSDRLKAAGNLKGLASGWPQ